MTDKPIFTKVYKGMFPEDVGKCVSSLMMVNPKRVVVDWIGQDAPEVRGAHFDLDKMANYGWRVRAYFEADDE